MKRLLALLLVLILCLSLFGCQTEQDRPDPTEPEKVQQEATQPKETQPAEKKASTPLLYKVSDESGNVAWLFGSIHVGREDFYPLPDYVMEAYRGSDALAVEVDILELESAPSQQKDALTALAYTDGSTIADHLPEETYQKAVAAMQELGVYDSAMDHFMPVVWWSVLQTALYERAGAHGDLGIDRYFLSLAKEEEKPVLEVESADAQYGMMAGFSEQTQVFLLEQMLVMYDSPMVMSLSLRALMNQWASGKEDALNKFFGTQNAASAEDQQASSELSQALTGQRDVDMTAYAVEALQSGKEVFICVGAAHIVGQGAVVESLRAMGYTVEIVH